MTQGKRVLRQRLWASDEVKGQSVGETLRNAESAILSQPQLREVEFENKVYSGDGITFPAKSAPRGAVVMYVARADGSWQTVNAVPELSFSNGAVTAKISGLTVGDRYAAIRLLVVG